MTESADNDLLELGRAELTELIESIGQPAFRAKQIWRQIHQRGQLDPDQMSDLPAELRVELTRRFSMPSQSAYGANFGRRLNQQGLTQTQRWRTGRNRPDPLTAARHRLPFVASGMRDGLRLLRHRSARPAKTAHQRRDHATGDARSILGARRRPRTHSRRLHGHGRTARQLCQREPRHRHPHRPRRLRALAETYHRLDRRRRPEHPPTRCRPPKCQFGSLPARPQSGVAGAVGSRARRVTESDHRGRERASTACQRPRDL